MGNSYFQFKQFTIYHDRCAMKVTTDSCLFGAWAAKEIENEKLRIEKVLDIGTGTGLLSLMIAQKKFVHTDAIEIDKEAALQAIENSYASPWSSNIQVLNKNILQLANNKQYDCIICNPPFYENDLKSGSSKKNIARHSHKLTLPQVMAVIKNKLADRGIFFLLLPAKRFYQVKQLIKEYSLSITKIVQVRQSVNHPYFRVMIMGINEENKESGVSEIAVWDENKNYTSEFTELLRDYYLYL